ncbi:MAG: hypothetical protein M1814_004454 [Vezdaea aestivalis]|nr:MAG: hypothetical protein M1814_004454 [Vezdaea aestivalis]
MAETSLPNLGQSSGSPSNLNLASPLPGTSSSPDSPRPVLYRGRLRDLPQPLSHLFMAKLCDNPQFFDESEQVRLLSELHYSLSAFRQKEYDSKWSPYSIGNIIVVGRWSDLKHEGFYFTRRMYYIDGAYGLGTLESILQKETGLFPSEFSLAIALLQLESPIHGTSLAQYSYIHQPPGLVKVFRCWVLISAERSNFTSVRDIIVPNNSNRTTTGASFLLSALLLRLPLVPGYGRLWLNYGDDSDLGNSLRTYVDGDTKIDAEITVTINLERAVRTLYNLIEISDRLWAHDLTWHLTFVGKPLDPNSTMKLKDCGITWGSAIEMVLDGAEGEQQANKSATPQEPGKNDDNRINTDNATTSSRAATIKTFFTGRSSFSQTFFSTQSRFSKGSSKLRPALKGFMKTIAERGLMPSIEEQLDWSSRGQHVEYELGDDPPLEAGRVLGWSSNAVVTEVNCRRIKLARKCIPCQKLSLEESLWEIAHLQKLQHAHIVRLIGSYLQDGALNILLYPVAECNLKEFMRKHSSEAYHMPRTQSDIECLHRPFLLRAMTCLRGAVDYIHSQTIRHMDIKPTNILVKNVLRKSGSTIPKWHILLTDFDVATDYKSSDTEHTNTARRFTELYASPEAADGDYKGRASDFFSLGCVFVEMITLVAGESLNGFERKRKDRYGYGAYYLNIEFCQTWLIGQITCSLDTHDEKLDIEIAEYLKPDESFRQWQLGTDPHFDVVDNWSWSNVTECISQLLTEDPVERWKYIGKDLPIIWKHFLELDENCCASGPMRLSKAGEEQTE